MGIITPNGVDPSTEKGATSWAELAVHVYLFDCLHLWFGKGMQLQIIWTDTFSVKKQMINIAQQNKHEQAIVVWCFC